MTFHQLEIFLALAREQNFTRAGQVVGLSQSTISEHVKELETELGKSLFVRRGRQTVLSEAGRIFQGYASQAVATIGDARRAIAELDGLARGSLIVGASTTPGIYLLPSVVGRFRVAHPGIEITLSIANSREIEEQVADNRLDLGVVGGHAVGGGKRCVAAGVLDELVLVVSPRHAWASRGVVGAEQLSEQPVLLREVGSSTRQVTKRAFEHAGIPMRAGLELGHTEAIKRAVMADLGVAFLSRHAVADELATGRLRAPRVRGLRIRRHFHVIHNEARMPTASARAFMTLLERTGRHGSATAPRRLTSRARGRG